MIRIIFLSIVASMANFLFAQTENYTIAMDTFQNHYNTEKYNEIFHRFSPQMQQALPLENTKQFFTELFKSVGKMETKEFVNDGGGTGVNYKVKFQWATLGVYIVLDNQNKISGLLVKPFEG